MKKLLYCCALLLAFALPRAAKAQALPDSSALKASVAAVRQRYTQATQAESRLLSGTEYVNYSRPNTVGHQFYLSPIAQLGILVYDGLPFAAVPLLYDLRRDQVITANSGSVTNLQLMAEKVQSFDLSGHHFVRVISADTAAGAAVPTGFYDLLVAGPERGASLLARRTKREAQEPVGGRVVFEYEEKTRLLVRQSNAYSEVATLKDCLALLPAHRAELQKYARSNHLKFKDSRREDSFVALLRYYNTLAL